MGKWNGNEYIIRTYPLMWIGCIMCVFAGAIFLLGEIALLASGEAGALWLSIPVIVVFLLFFIFMRLCTEKVILSPYGIRIFIFGNKRYEFNWEEFRFMYIMKGSYIFNINFAVITSNYISEFKRMILIRTKIIIKRNGIGAIFRVNLDDVYNILKFCNMISVINEL